MGRLDGKIAIITGGARGIGAASARLFIAEGATVVIADLLDAEGHALAKELGRGAAFFHLDVTDEAGWQQVVAETLRHHGRVDALVNTAGIGPACALLECEAKAFEHVFQVNVLSIFLGIKAVAPAMIKQGQGSIVNISSVSGLQGFNGMGAYVSSKWGVRGLTKVAALELGPLGVRLNVICPGVINTPLINATGVAESELNAGFKRQPIQRIGKPGEVANAILFLASDEASYMCGAEITVDGGMAVGDYVDYLPGAPFLNQAP